MQSQNDSSSHHTASKHRIPPTQNIITMTRWYKTRPLFSSHITSRHDFLYSVVLSVIVFCHLNILLRFLILDKSSLTPSHRYLSFDMKHSTFKISTIRVQSISICKISTCNFLIKDKISCLIPSKSGSSFYFLYKRIISMVVRKSA